MKRKPESFQLQSRLRNSSLAVGLLALALWPARARASIFQGEALDTAADVLTWVVLVVAPIVAITVFLLIHILPEKIAEKKNHPQAKAIQCLCLLSLVFGGLLWPLAWLWAYSKPVFYRMAYGTDEVPHGHEKETKAPEQSESDEVKQLRKRVAELEAKSAGKPAAEGGKA
jgi:CBS domain containing-hemolysin-like protein